MHAQISAPKINKDTGDFEELFLTLTSYNHGSGCILESIPDIASQGVNGINYCRYAMGK